MKIVYFFSFFFLVNSQAWAFPINHKLSFFQHYKEQRKEILWAKETNQNKQSLRIVDQTPLDWPIILLQGFSGSIVGSVAHLIFQSIFQAIFINEKSSLDDLNMTIFLSTSVTFGIVPWLTALSVYALAPFIYAYHGSYWWALIGAYVGGGVSFALGQLVYYADSSRLKSVAIPMQVLFNGLFMGIGSVLFFTLFRRPFKDIIQLGSLLNFSGNRFSWGVPLPLAMGEKEHLKVSFSLLSGHF